MNPAVAVLVGLGTYVLLWRDPSVAPFPSGPGLWRGAPSWFRRLVHSGDGPVVISALAIQVAALVMLMVGVITWFGLGGEGLRANGLVIVTFAWVAAITVWGLLAIRARFFWHW